MITSNQLLVMKLQHWKLHISLLHLEKTENFVIYSFLSFIKQNMQEITCSLASVVVVQSKVCKMVGSFISYIWKNRAGSEDPDMFLWEIL